MNLVCKRLGLICIAEDNTTVPVYLSDMHNVTSRTKFEEVILEVGGYLLPPSRYTYIRLLRATNVIAYIYNSSLVLQHFPPPLPSRPLLS